MPQSFNDLTQSQGILARLQSMYGSMQPGSLQILRKEFYSYVAYGTGSNIFQFFGNAIGNNGITRQLTNMPLQGTFGTSSFLVKKVSLDYFISANNLSLYAGTDASTMFSEFTNGLFQAGVFKLDINAKNYLQINKPFLYAPPSDGRSKVYSAGQVSAIIDKIPYADLSRKEDNAYVVDPEVFIESQQNFAASLEYPSGPITPLVTTLTGSTTVIYVGVRLSGVQFRPVS